MNKNTRKNNKKGLRKTRSNRQKGGAGKKMTSKKTMPYYYSPDATYNKENKDRVKQKANKMLLRATYNLELDDIKKALKKGADINVQGEGGNTALHMAIEDGDILIVEFLLKNGANIYIENEFKQNAIDLAVEYGDNIYVYVGEESDGYDQMMDGLNGPTIRDGPILTLLRIQDIENKRKYKLNKYLKQ